MEQIRVHKNSFSERVAQKESVGFYDTVFYDELPSPRVFVLIHQTCLQVGCASPKTDATRPRA